MRHRAVRERRCVQTTQFGICLSYMHASIKNPLFIIASHARISNALARFMWDFRRNMTALTMTAVNTAYRLQKWIWAARPYGAQHRNV